MELVEGQSLRELIRQGDLPPVQVLDIAIQICDGLTEAHEAGVVHRDIKPANILVDRKNRARLVDFGLASVAEASKLTRTGSTLGTVGYMSPEQLRGGNGGRPRGYLLARGCPLRGCDRPSTFSQWHGSGHHRSGASSGA
jgi:serine/threonine-protein kinase